MRRFAVVAATAAVVVLVAGWWRRRGARITGGHHGACDRARDDGQGDRHREGGLTDDVLTWHNKVYDETDTTVAGSDQGDCVRISPKQGTWECPWVTWLDGGSITVEGPSTTRRTASWITGGTGAYASATVNAARVEERRDRIRLHLQPHVG